MTEEAALLARIQERLGPLVTDAGRTGPRRLVLHAAPAKAKEVVRVLREELGCRHLTAISALDTGDAIEVMYHMSHGGCVVSLHTPLPRASLRIATVTDLLPSANLYEREVRDLFGIEFEGHPDPRRLMLYEDWPEGEHPLRKDWKPKPKGGEPHA